MCELHSSHQLMSALTRLEEAMNAIKYVVSVTSGKLHVVLRMFIAHRIYLV